MYAHIWKAREQARKEKLPPETVWERKRKTNRQRQRRTKS